MSAIPKPTRRGGSGHYDANYKNFESELYAEIRREAFGEDIGQSSWITADEQDRTWSMLNLVAGKNLLDVACGSGGPALRIAESTGCSLVGVDVHQDAVSTGNSLAGQRGLSQRARFQVADATARMPFPDASFDAITCIDAINHLPDRPRVMVEFARLLKPGGRLLFTDPIILTGPLTNEEMTIRSSIGYFLFVPDGYDANVITASSLRLLLTEDVTENMARLAQARGSARAVREQTLRSIEGDQT